MPVLFLCLILCSTPPFVALWLSAFATDMTACDSAQSHN